MDTAELCAFDADANKRLLAYRNARNFKIVQRNLEQRRLRARYYKDN